MSLSSHSLLSWRRSGIPAHLVVAATAWGSRVVTAVVGLFTIRILIQALGTELYAVYAVLGGLQGWYLLTDLGIGNSLQNHISERRAQGRAYGDFIITAGSIMVGLLFLSVALLYVISPFLAPLILKGFSFVSDEDKSSYFFITGVISILTCFGGIAYRIWYAEQKGYLANILPAAASFVSFGLVIAVANSSLPHKLYWCLIAVFGPSGVFPAVAFLKQFANHLRLRHEINPEILWPLVKRSLKFSATAILAAAVLQVDYLVMAQYLPPKEIVVYNLTSKIFALVYFIYTALLTAVWPVCAEAAARREWHVVMGYVKKYIVIGVLLLAGSTVFLAFFMPEVIGLLSPKKVVAVPVLFLIVMGVYNIIRIWSDTFAMVLQSMSYLRPFVIYIPVQAIITGFLQIYFAPRYGAIGIIYGLLGSFILTSVWILPMCVYRRRRVMV